MPCLRVTVANRLVVVIHTSYFAACCHIFSNPSRRSFAFSKTKTRLLVVLAVSRSRSPSFSDQNCSMRFTNATALTMHCNSTWRWRRYSGYREASSVRIRFVARDDRVSRVSLMLLHVASSMHGCATTAPGSSNLRKPICSDLKQVDKRVCARPSAESNRRALTLRQSSIRALKFFWNTLLHFGSSQVMSPNALYTLASTLQS